jgi:putative SOS response-associated peptidase YedK
MPVILPERDYSRWLDVDSSQLPMDLLRPYEADQMTAWEVDKRIGNVRNDSPELFEEQSTPPKEPSLFDDAPL